MTKSRDTADVRNYAENNQAEIAVLENVSRYKNYIDNPSMAVSQENGDGPTAITATVDYYGADRHGSFITSGTGGAATVERSTSIANRKSLKITASTALTTLTTTQNLQPYFHRCEAQDVYHLNGQQVTLSFQCKTNWAGNLAVVVANHDHSKSYIADLAVVSGDNSLSLTLTLESATVDAIDNGVGLQLFIGACNEGSYQHATTNSWETGTYLCSTSSTQWAKTLNNYIEISDVQLVEGDTAPKFQPNSYAEDLAKCQRYFERIAVDTPANNEMLGLGIASSATSLNGYIRYVQKRAIPTISASGTLNLADGVASHTGTYSSATDQGLTGSRLLYTSTGMTAYRPYLLRSLSASIIDIDARL